MVTALISALLCWSACGGSDNNSTKQQAAVLGTASSPALDALAPLLEIGVSDAEADALIVDCKTHPAGTLAGNARINRFLARGKDVLFLDASESHSSQDLIPLLHGTHAGEARALLARKGTDPHGRPEYTVYAFPGDLSEVPTAAELEAFYFGANTHLSRAATPPADSAFNPPPGLLYVIFNFSLPPGSVEFTSTKDGTDSTNGTQYTSLVQNYRYTLLLENGNVATGDRQFVVAESELESSPLNADKFSDKLMIIKPGNGFVSCDIGWFQVELDLVSNPVDQSQFVFQTSSPQNANQVTMVNSRISFGISFLLPKGGTGNFGYTSNDSTDLTAWAVVNSGNGSIGSWQYKNQNPWLWNSPDTWDDLFAFGSGIEIDGAFKVPGTLATDQVQANVKMVWATASPPLKRPQSFDTAAAVTYLNVWAPAFGSIHSGAQGITSNGTWSIDMAAVLPIQIARIGFSRDPVNASSRHSVTGTVELESAAVVDTIVYLSSDSQNATVLPSVVVPQGQTSADFQILVNTDGIPRGGSTVATIEAFNATAAQAQLTIRN
ncbi:MAG: hypothetical protein AB7V27_19195 [Candidatus Binatia bacterium]